MVAPIIEPGGKSHPNHPDTPLAQVDNTHILLILELQPKQQKAGEEKQHQAEGINSLDNHM